MSADNGIYVLRTLRTRKETSPGCWTRAEPHYVWRVAETSAIDNFDWYQNAEIYNLGAYMKDIWGDSEVFQSELAALEHAHKVAKEYDILEYGVVQIDTDYKFFGDM